RRLGLVVAEHGALDLPRIRHGGLDDDLAIELGGKLDGGAKFGRVAGLRDADARSEVRGFDEHRKSERRDGRAHQPALVTAPVAYEERVIVADRQAVGG